MGVSIFNTGYDLQDQIDAAESAIAIVSIGDTHVAITSGQYVYVREHGTLAEGLYRATANIAANATLSGSNVTAVSGGGLNALNSNLEKVVGTYSVFNLSSYTAKTFIEKIVNDGHKIYYCSATGANKLSDLPIVQAGLYIVYADSYYKKLFFNGTDGRDYQYDYETNTWSSIFETFNNKNLATCVEGSVSWGQNIVIARGSQNHAVRVTGGREGYGFIVYIPKNTQESIILINVGNAVGTVTVTGTTITITTASSGYGTTLYYTAEVW